MPNDKDEVKPFKDAVEEVRSILKEYTDGNNKNFSSFAEKIFQVLKDAEVSEPKQVDFLLIQAGLRKGLESLQREAVSESLNEAIQYIEACLDKVSKYDQDPDSGTDYKIASLKVSFNIDAANTHAGYWEDRHRLQAEIAKRYVELAGDFYKAAICKDSESYLKHRADDARNNLLSARKIIEHNLMRPTSFKFS